MGGRAKHGSRAVEAIPLAEAEPAKAPVKLSKPPPAALSAARPETRRDTPQPQQPPRPPSSSPYPFRSQEAAVNNVIAHQRATLRARIDADAHILQGLRTWACDQIVLNKPPMPRIQVYK
jgi:hypothetical protein